MGNTYDQLRDSISTEGKKDVNMPVNLTKRQIELQKIRESLAVSQQSLATKMGISQPSVVAIEKRGENMKLLTLIDYVHALGGELDIDITLPNGKQLKHTFK